MSTATQTWGSGDNEFTLTYKNDEVITTSGDHSYMSSNFEANSFAAFQSKKLTQFFEAGNAWDYNSANEDNCIWRKWDGLNRTDLLAGSDAPDGYFTSNSLLYNDGTYFRIITDLSDIQRVIWRPEVAETYVDTYINGTSTRVYYYVVNTNSNQHLCDIIDKTNPMNYTARDVMIQPWLLNPHDKTQLQTHFKRYDQLSVYGNYCERNSGSRFNGINNERYYPLSTAMINYTVPTGNNQNFAFYDDTNAYLMHCTLSTNNYAQGSLNCYITSEDELKLYLASAGFKFIYKNVLYKPVAENDVIVGYTNDMLSQSDWDSWHTKGDHTIPVTPPAPGGTDEDNNDPISTNDAPFGSGLAHYYVTTAGSVLLEHISEALGTWDIDTSKKDLYRNLISCKLIKPPAAIPTTGSENFTIYGVQPEYQGSPVLLPVVSGNPSATFGSYSISRKFNDFRDFAPYSKAEIFLPYCGWTALPSHVIGRSVSVKYFTDIIAATCKAVVFCGNNVVAEAAGVIGLDIPFASENVGAKMEAANMGLLASTLGAVQTAVGVGTMVSTKSGSGLKNVTSGLSQVISGCTQISMAGNENWTEINGKAGDGCSLAGIDTIIIKITRPKYGTNSTPPYVPSGYAHNIGYVAMKQTKPGNVTGLLVCDNVDTSGISGATQRERELIKSYLESGIIVNAVSP